MKNILILGTVTLLMVGCTPKINSMKSPINSLDQKCFNLPNKTYLSNSSINKQTLYVLTYNALKQHGVPVTYGNTHSCKNYLNTSWEVTTSKALVSSGGDSQTYSYGNIYSNLGYSMPYSYQGTSQTYVTPITTSEKTTYYGTYTLEVGTIKKNKVIKVWEATQSASLGASTLQEAEKVQNSDQDTVNIMVDKMLKENGFIK